MTGIQPKRRWLWLLNNTLNRLTVRIARSGRGPFSLVRHVGRRSGTIYETPLILARTPGGFVAELTYGAGVDWYRNVVAAGDCVIISGGVEYRSTGSNRVLPTSGSGPTATPPRSSSGSSDDTSSAFSAPLTAPDVVDTVEFAQSGQSCPQGPGG